MIGHPPAVALAVGCLGEGELRAGMRPLTADQDPHRRRPAGELVPRGALPQQLGQLSDLGFLCPAAAVPAVRAGAGPDGAALADLSVPGDRQAPRGLRDEPDRGALAGSHGPAHGVGQLPYGSGGELARHRVRRPHAHHPEGQLSHSFQERNG
jgi:hypothetical protein